jgi:hypothetical protein
MVDAVSIGSPEEAMPRSNCKAAVDLRLVEGRENLVDFRASGEW